MSESEMNLRVTGKSSQGGRRYMEDAFVVAYQYTEDKMDLEYAFFGIFDGHGGKEAAQYAKNNLLDNIVNLKYFWQDDDDMILSAIRDGFLNTHMAMWKEVATWPKTASGQPSTAGTTASVAFIRKGKLYTGHVGDSRIIIGLKEQGTDEWQAESLTIDHKPESPLEKQRILESGGLVMNKSGVERVVWKRPKPGHEGPILRSTDFEKIPFLAVARSLGDLWSYDYFQQEFAVSPEPDLGVMSLDLTKDKCLVLASDGLWNIMSPQAAVHLVQDVENENKKFVTKFGVSKNIHLTLCNPSRVLVDCALERWNRLRIRADNVSVVTVMLDQIKSSDVGVLREQLALKMNYPRKLPVVSLLSKGHLGDAEILIPKSPFTATEIRDEIGTKDLSSSFQTSSCISDISTCTCCENCKENDAKNIATGCSDCQDCSFRPQNNICDTDSENHPSCSNATGNCDSTQNTPSSNSLADRYTSSPLQSCSNFLPEYFPSSPTSKVSRKRDADGIENSPCPFPRWSKNESGRTSLSKLISWSRVVSHRRKSDPCQQQSIEICPLDSYSLSDNEDVVGFEDEFLENDQTAIFNQSSRDPLCCIGRSVKEKFGRIEVVNFLTDYEEMGLDRDLCDENVINVESKHELCLNHSSSTCSRKCSDEVPLHVFSNSIDAKLDLDSDEIMNPSLNNPQMCCIPQQNTRKVGCVSKNLHPLLPMDLKPCSECMKNCLTDPCTRTSPDHSCSQTEPRKKYFLEENSHMFMIVDELGFERDLCDDDVPISSVGLCPKSEQNCTKQLSCYETEPSYHTADLRSDKDPVLPFKIKNENNFKVSLDQLCSLKQAIKRKYPGAEISNSFISSSPSANDSVGSFTQKRRVERDMDSILAKIDTDVHS